MDFAAAAGQVRSMIPTTVTMGILENGKGTRAVRTAVNDRLVAEMVSMPKVGEGYEINGLRIEVEPDGMFTLSFTVPGGSVVAATGSINHKQIELAKGNGSH